MMSPRRPSSPIRKKSPDTKAATEKPAGGLSPGDRNQLVSALVLDIRAERIHDGDKSDEQIRAEIKSRARLLFATFREPPIPIPENREVVLDAEQDKEVEGLLTQAFEAAGPRREATPPTPRSPSSLLSPSSSAWPRIIM